MNREGKGSYVSGPNMWSFLWPAGGRVEELDAGECRRLLESVTVGRLGYTSQRGPRIIPVNYALGLDSVAFRTGQQTEVARLALGRTVAFEVDQVDDFLRSGWSVLIVGKLTEMSPSAVRMLDVSQTPAPWAGGERTLYCEIPFSELSGRRIHPG
jgi:hypothetical protein